MATLCLTYPHLISTEAQNRMTATAGMPIGQADGLNLPEGVKVANPGRRIGAFFLSMVLSIVTLGIGYLIWGIIVWGRGQTPALQVLGMRCWRPKAGRAAGWWRMAVREIIGNLVENILSIITLVISFLMMLSSADHKCIHDAVAGVVVVHDPNKVLARR
jgi:uncharacterized RDD family membrane protein YckC